MRDAAPVIFLKASWFPDDTTMLHFLIDRRLNTSMRKQLLHIFFRMEDMTCLLSCGFIVPNSFSSNIQVGCIYEHEPIGLFSGSSNYLLRMNRRDVTSLHLKLHPIFEV